MSDCGTVRASKRVKQTLCRSLEDPSEQMRLFATERAVDTESWPSFGIRASSSEEEEETGGETTHMGPLPSRSSTTR